MPPKSPDLEVRLEILKKIASTYADDSKEYETVKMAAEALLFIDGRGDFAALANRMKESAQPLTEEQLAHLQRIGCAPY